ncbi:MAG: ABC transporter permease [Desulfovibrio sp.]|uniref:ABC transporter permease n=1 Tax=Desulfovibrio sp. TaxID=885 RepID=UPI001A78C9AD|nr:ABC transporter permease [Desulfovibrio sp.]MBD5417453.1 ABC transporter permease [Desulfovibrio sp.]
MTALRRWFAGVFGSMGRECREWAGNAREVIFCNIMPLVWMLIVWGLLGQGIMTRVPVALVDEDKSSASREVIRALDANRALGLESYENSIGALAAMRQGAVYGVIVIPAGYMRDELSGAGGTVVIHTDENRYAVGGTFAIETAAVMDGLSQERTAQKLLRAGAGPTGAERILSLVHPDFYRLANMGSSFLIFLSSTLIPGLIIIGATFAFMTAILREIWNRSVAAWLASAGGSFGAALVGKLTPHYVYYCLVILFYIALFSGYGSFAPAGSVLTWFFCGAAAVAAIAAMCVLITGIAPTWRLALVISVGYAAPALPFSGFSIPLDSMDAGVRFYADFLPLTWYIRGQSQVWALGAGLDELGTTFLALALLFVVPLIIGLPFFRRKYGRFAASEEAGRP